MHVLRLKTPKYFSLERIGARLWLVNFPAQGHATIHVSFLVPERAKNYHFISPFVCPLSKYTRSVLVRMGYWRMVMGILGLKRNEKHFNASRTVFFRRNCVLISDINCLDINGGPDIRTLTLDCYCTWLTNRKQLALTFKKRQLSINQLLAIVLSASTIQVHQSKTYYRRSTEFEVFSPRVNPSAMGSFHTHAYGHTSKYHLVEGLCVFFQSAGFLFFK